MSRLGTQDKRRRLPSVDRLLRHPRVERLQELYGRDLVRVQMRRSLDELRGRLAGGDNAAEDLDRAIAALPERLEAALGESVGWPLRRVVNATGIFLHTNLGRSPLPRGVAARLPAYLDAYCDLEMDLENGRRGDRNRRAQGLLTALTGAEAAVVTNNNAAAMVLILAAHALQLPAVLPRYIAAKLVDLAGDVRVVLIGKLLQGVNAGRTIDGG